MKTGHLAERYCVADGKNFKLKRYPPADTSHLKPSKEEAQERLKQGIERLRVLQDTLYAQDRWSLLLIFQAMDAAGKDSAIKHVMSGVNPQGCHVASFKAPAGEEREHDYLWRCVRHLPERGTIGIFNRSYYEEVLVVRVHPEILGKQKLPPSLITKKIWDQRFEDIRAFERYLARNGTIVRKFFLNVSRQEQRRRFLERLDDPEKHWKFEAADVSERQHWNEYMRCYEDMISNTATEEAPWYVVPADHKWFTRLIVADAITEALEGLKLRYPRVHTEEHKTLAAARAVLENESK
jgi:PPK2 family polyphosphate:nucleotide phosphotransferase